MRVGAVILNYNSWQMSARLAEKMASFNAIDEVVVVDNSSTDGSLAGLRTITNPKIEVVESGKNGGYSYGNNYGAKILLNHKCDYLVISNPDVDVEERSVIEILNAFGGNADFGVLSGIEYDTEDNVSEPAIWKNNRYIDDLKDCFYFGRKIKEEHTGINYSRKIQPVEMVKGSFFIVNAKDFERIGGFDENVFLFCEERILAQRMLSIGKKIGIVTDTKYNHNHSASISNEYKSLEKQVKILYKSRYYYNCKYNHIGIVKKMILLVGMRISLMEYFMIDAIRKRKQK